ncbi:MAG: L,D-transpeptidase family protein [Methyloceanibacter sp.]|uniref:L,D-transpeptidase family protein n=1 Tax=Methyloceanibacter sp. TaxID=1965321 RepID=UPI003D6D2B02
MRVKRPRPIVVRRAPGRPQQARVQLAHGGCRAAIGRSGLRALKREGDGGTPLGRFAVRLVLYRADRVGRPRTALHARAIRAYDGWCEDPTDRNYNRLVRHSLDGDRLMREDHLYDLVLVLGYNDRPRVRGKGSAIFVHLARLDYLPTAGCIALNRRDLLALIAQLRPRTSILVTR